jgi:hypothetical protein
LIVKNRNVGNTTNEMSRHDHAVWKVNIEFLMYSYACT